MVFKRDFFLLYVRHHGPSFNTVNFFTFRHWVYWALMLPPFPQDPENDTPPTYDDVVVEDKLPSYQDALEMVAKVSCSSRSLSKVDVFL